MIKFLIYKYRSPRENANTYQCITSNEDETLNETTSSHNSHVNELSNDENMIFSNYVSNNHCYLCYDIIGIELKHFISV